MNQPNRVVLYTRYDCGYSDRIKSDLEKDGIDYQEIDVAMKPEFVVDLLKLTDGERIVPVLVRDNTVSIGHNGIGCTF